MVRGKKAQNFNRYIKAAIGKNSLQMSSTLIGNEVKRNV